MAAPLPQGLIVVVPTERAEIPADPAEAAYERKQALHKFWKVHDAQSRTTHSTSDTRCRNLFWRVWGNSHLALNLKQTTMLSLYVGLQQPLNLNPFMLQTPLSLFPHIGLSGRVARRNDIPQHDTSRESHLELSPHEVLHKDTANYAHQPSDLPEGGSVEHSNDKDARRSFDRRPRPARLSSGGASSGVRTRARTRPVITRKRSSQISQGKGDKSARATRENTQAVHRDCLLTEHSQPAIRNQQDMHEDLQSALEPMSRRISAFELPSASSWQSTESHDHMGLHFTESSTGTQPSLMIDKNFRKRFSESQKALRSSIGIPDSKRLVTKTGSVVRFADEVDVAKEFRRYVNTDQLGSDGDLQHGLVARADSEELVGGFQPLNRQDSIGSVAAVSDDEDDISSDIQSALPRVASQLSIAIARQRTQSSQAEASTGNNDAATSEEIEDDRPWLASNSSRQDKDEVEEKLLAMGRKDGVTKGGGVNLPKEPTIDSARSPVKIFDKTEQTTF